MSFGTGLLRVAVGASFVGHGLQKLNGSFGGPGLRGVEGVMKNLNMYPAKRNALLAALTETLGGAGVLTGAATPLAAAGLIGTMVTAIRKVHLKNGLFNSDGGYEYNAVLVASLAVIAAGPGTLSFDAVIGKKKWGVGGTLFALIVGFAASAALIELGERNAPPAEDEAAAAE